MTSIMCDTYSTNGVRMLHALVPSLSSLMAPAAQLCIDLDTGMLLRDDCMQALTSLRLLL